MNDKRCSRCKEEFTSDGLGMVCPDCLKQEEDEFSIVREAVLYNTNLNALQLSKATGVHISKITKFIREGKLSLNPKGHSN